MVTRLSRISFKIIANLIAFAIKKSGIYNIGGHFLYTKSIDSKALFIDLGANKGVFYTALNSKFQTKGYAIEASPELYNKLPVLKHVVPFNFAINNEKGVLKFNISENNEANSANIKIASEWGLLKTIEVPCDTLENFISEHKISNIDILKVDIEGAELEMFESTTDYTFQKIAQIAVEFHDFLDDSHASAIFNIVSRMQKLGFWVIVFSDNDYREVLMLNKHYIHLTLSNRISLLLFIILKRLKKFRQDLFDILKK